MPLSAAQFGASVRRRLPVPHRRRTRRSGTRTRTTCSRASASPTRSTRRRCCAAASGSTWRPSRSRACPASANPINQFGYSRNTPGRHQPDNGLTFVGDLTQPGARKRAAGADRLQPGPVHQPGRQPRRATLGSSSRTATTRRSGASRFGVQRELPGNFLVELTYLGQRGQNIPYVEQPSTSCPSSSARRTRATTRRPTRSSPPSCPTRSAASRPRTRRPTAPPSPAAACCRPTRTSARSATEFYDGSNRYDGGYIRLEKRFTNGFMLSTSYTYSALPREGGAAQPLGGPGGPHRRRRPSAPHHGRDRGRAAVRQGPQVRHRLERPGGRDPRRLAARRPLRVADGRSRSSGTTSTSIPAAATPRTSSSRPGATTREGRKYGVDVPIIDTTCFYTYNGQPVPQRRGQRGHLPGARDPARRGQHPRASRPRSHSVRFQSHHILDIGLTKNFMLGSRVKLQIRAEALNATNYTIFNVGNIRPATWCRRRPTSAADQHRTRRTVIRPRDIQLGAKITF